jgi:hypothetical protein
MINKLNYFEVFDAYDVEGRGPYKVIGTFSTDRMAHSYAKGQGNYGNDAMVREVTVFVCDTIQDALEQNERVELNNVLNKLSNEDIELLKKHFDKDVK